MKRLIVLFALTPLAAGCSLPSVPNGASGLSSLAYGADPLGGLPASEAAHYSIESTAPTAFALMPNSAAFLQALQTTVEPMRQSLAATLASDPTIASGLASWERASSKQQLALLERAAALEGQVMNFSVPPIQEQPAGSGQAGLMAFFQPDDTTLGHVALYPDAISQGGKYLALATVVHEMRHAAQYQLVTAYQNGSLPSGSAEETLAKAYNDAWQAMGDLGGEENLAYGDYAHLNVEYDAFQTGNEVATRLGGSAFNSQGFGFTDVQFTPQGTFQLDVLSLEDQQTGASLVGAVNSAEAQAEQHTGAPPTHKRHPRTPVVVGHRATATAKMSNPGNQEALWRSAR